jgi:hypothetical protein
MENQIENQNETTSQEKVEFYTWLGIPEERSAKRFDEIIATIAKEAISITDGFPSSLNVRTIAEILEKTSFESEREKIYAALKIGRISEENWINQYFKQKESNNEDLVNALLGIPKESDDVREEDEDTRI